MKYVVTVNGQDVVLEENEAKRLYVELNKVFGDKKYTQTYQGGFRDGQYFLYPPHEVTCLHETKGIKK
jgi:hypothetical protein